ncbi:unnamed protein product [Rhodiola kirilowii]
MVYPFNGGDYVAGLLAGVTVAIGHPFDTAKMLVDEISDVTITNDGATIL